MAYPVVYQRDDGVTRVVATPSGFVVQFFGQGEQRWHSLLPAETATYRAIGRAAAFGRKPFE